MDLRCVQAKEILLPLSWFELPSLFSLDVPLYCKIKTFKMQRDTRQGKTKENKMATRHNKTKQDKVRQV
jgi:hypothetical protein